MFQPIKNEIAARRATNSISIVVHRYELSLNYLAGKISNEERCNDQVTMPHLLCLRAIVTTCILYCGASELSGDIRNVLSLENL